MKLLFFLLLLSYQSLFAFEAREYREIKKIAGQIVAEFPPDHYVYLGLGSELVGLVAYFELKHGPSSAIVLPPNKQASSLATEFYLKPSPELDQHLKEFLPEQDLVEKKILLLKLGNSDWDLLRASFALQNHLNRRDKFVNFVEPVALVSDSESQRVFKEQGDLPSFLISPTLKQFFERTGERIRKGYGSDSTSTMNSLRVKTLMERFINKDPLERIRKGFYRLRERAFSQQEVLSCKAFL